MRIVKLGVLYAAFPQPDEVHLASQAGFELGAAMSQVWTTDNPVIAQRLEQHCDAGVRASIAADIAASAVTRAEWPLLQPTGKRASEQVAEIRMLEVVSTKQKLLSVRFAEKNDDFREAVKGIGFRWAQEVREWRRPLDAVKSGAPADRMAELAHVLLDAGFLVRIFSVSGNAAAVTGTFEEEQTRWVDVYNNLAAPVYVGWLALAWRRDDDCYEVSRTLPGSRWVPPYVMVPPGNIDAVIDFAGSHDFACTAAVYAAQDARNDQLANGIVLNLPAKKKKVTPTRQVRPGMLTPRVGEIHNDLRDND